MFYPPKGLCKADTEGGPIVFTYILFCARKRILEFQFCIGYPPFWDPPNVLSPGGTLQSRARKGSNCFYFQFYWCRKRYWGFQNPNFQEAFLEPWKCFIPRRDSAKQIPKEVQLFLLMSYFVLGNVYWTLNLLTVFRLFKTFKMIYPEGTSACWLP